MSAPGSNMLELALQALAALSSADATQRRQAVEFLEQVRPRSSRDVAEGFATWLLTRNPHPMRCPCTWRRAAAEEGRRPCAAVRVSVPHHAPC